MTAMIGRGVSGVGIVGSASVPGDGDGRRIVGNDEIDALLLSRGASPMTAGWIAKMGVAERMWTSVPGSRPTIDRSSDAGAATDELLAEAANLAMIDAGVAPRDVDLLIAATTTTSRLTTSMAAMAGGRLGIQCGAFEVRAGCASASYAVALAYSQVAMGARCVVVTSAETLTKVAPRTGPLPYLAGDGAAALVMVRVDDDARGLVGSWLHGDGSAASLAGAPGHLPPNAADLESDRYRLVADRRFDEAAAPWWPIGPQAVLDATQHQAVEVNAFVANQANSFRLMETATQIGISPARVVDIVASTANAGAASQLTAFDSARKSGKASEGNLVLMSAVGGGLSAASLLIRP